MARLIVGVVALLVLSVGAASADGFGDFNAGISAAVHDNSDAAIRYLTLALGEADLPDHLKATAYLARGQEYLEQKHSDAAFADFASAIALRPDWPDTYLNRCDAYAAARQFDRAIADCTRAIAVQPDNWRLRARRIEYYYDTKDFADIVADYSLFIAKRPDDPGLLLDRAYAFQVSGAFDKALADVAAAHDIEEMWANPAKAQTVCAKGRIYFVEGHYSDSADAYDDCEDMDTGSALASLWKGQAQWAMGHPDDAAVSFRRALKRAPLQPFAFLWLSLVLSQQNLSVPPDIISRFGAARGTGLSGALVSLYLGKSPPDTLMSLAEQKYDPTDDTSCVSAFYVGEWLRIQAKPEDSRRLLDIAISNCDANTELHQLAVVARGQSSGTSH
jgi:tetratricopeptide (TPR) repeat protein